MMKAELKPSKALETRKLRLGDLLVKHKVITEAQLADALARQKQTRRKLGRELIESNIIDEEQLARFLSEQLGVPYVDLKAYQLDLSLAQSFPENYARRYRCVALKETEDGGLLIGMSDPTDIFAYDEISRRLKRPVYTAVVQEHELAMTLDQVYRRAAQINDLADEVSQGVVNEVQQLATHAVKAGSENDAPIVKFLQTMFEDAVQVGASDIHIEPDEKELRIRLRQDGVLHVQARADPKVSVPLLSRLKLLAGLDISEKRLPQDGRFRIKTAQGDVDVRISTVPVQYGEAAVMRLLNQSAGVLSLDRIGMPDEVLTRFRRLIRSPNGMVLVTGPTGSGKTTTLYAALSELNSPERKILTAEDPVEYRLPGISQVQVNTKIDLNFARVLRSFLRQDPDVILVGEMRDRETVEIGLRAAITGHFVLSTLHTNDAIATATRLIDMGAAPYLIAAALKGIVAQRLVRRICSDCRETHVLDAREQAVIAAALGEEVLQHSFRRGRGCNHCNGTGYRGRAAVYEILEMTPALIKLLQSNDMIRFAEQARREPAYRSLRRAAVELAVQGVTTLEQVLHVTLGME